MIASVAARLTAGLRASRAASARFHPDLRRDRLRPSTALGWRECLDGLREGAVQTVPVAMACASAGIMIGIVLQTGLALPAVVDSCGGVQVEVDRREQRS